MRCDKDNRAVQKSVALINFQSYAAIHVEGGGVICEDCIRFVTMMFLQYLSQIALWDRHLNAQ
jgi:hypothetical protein